MSFLKFSLKSSVLIASVLVLSLSAGYIALAWTEPTGTMPVTVAAPLNTGTAAQTKNAALAVTGNLTAPMLYDSDNTAYYLNPAGQTVLAGNVGIGTAPSVLLHVKQPSGNLVTRFEGSSNAYTSKMYISSVSSGDGGMYYSPFNNNSMDIFSYGDMRFDVGTGNISGAIANERMVINQAGNIGIGTTAPATRLHVLQSSYNYQDSIVESALPSIRLVDNENNQISYGFLVDGNNLYFDAYTYANRFVNSYGTHLLTIQSDGKLILNNTGQLCFGSSCVDLATWNKMIYAGMGGGKQKFETSGTFTVPAGVTAVTVSMCGGGGGGGIGPGGAGATCVISQDVASVTPGQNIAVTIGAGGAGSLFSLNPGPTLCGAGGISSFGSFLSNAGGAGCGGYPPLGTDGTGNYGATGGAGTGSVYGVGGIGGRGGGPWENGASGAPGTGYGAGGGGGGGAGKFTSTCGDGGNGSPGVVIVEW